MKQTATVTTTIPAARPGAQYDRAAYAPAVTGDLSWPLPSEPPASRVSSSEGAAHAGRGEDAASEGASTMACAEWNSRVLQGVGSQQSESILTLWVLRLLP